MGQQQLLLIVLGVIVVGLAVVVGFTLFKTNAADLNRNAIINDLINLASKAQRHYKVSRVLGGGGGQYFDGLILASNEQSNDNGEYRFSPDVGTASTATTSAPAANAGNTIIPGLSNTTTIYITGYGTETGTDGTNLVQVYVTVTSSSINTSVVN